MCEFTEIHEAEERLARIADNQFIIGEEYESRIIAEFARTNNSIFHNPTAHTYNRWNIGMCHGGRFDQILPLFEFIANNRYRFIGSRLSDTGKAYTGIVCHYPQGGYPIEVGHWVNGCFNWIPGREMGGH